MIKVVYDWNGTLFDDVHLSLAILQRLMKEHGLGPIPNLEKYRDVFDFPVIEYYKKLGFDFDKLDWDEVANDYMDEYVEKCENVNLFSDALPVMRQAEHLGYENIILSASEKNNLLDQIGQFNFEGLLDEIYGIENIYANSKVHLAHELKKDSDPDDTIVFIGDSLHDAEVASEIGADCILVDRGHQSRERLETSGSPVVSSLWEALDLIYDMEQRSQQEEQA